MEGMFLRMIVSLLAVLALMAGLFYLAKRFVLPGAKTVRMPVPIELLGRRALQPKKSIVIVRIAGKVLVLGLSEQGMHVLTELTHEELETGSLMQTSGAAAPGLPFSAHLYETLRSLGRRQKSEVGV